MRNLSRNEGPTIWHYMNTDMRDLPGQPTPATLPTLASGQLNRVLYFRGSFNPPHLGHLGLLLRCYEVGHACFNVVGAIIELRPDREVAAKLHMRGDTGTLTEEVRQQLWLRDVGFPPWAFVVRSTSTTYHDLPARTMADGYTVAMVSVVGPDCLEPYLKTKRLRADTWVSDVARSASFVGPLGRLLPLPGFRNWTPIPWEDVSLRHLSPQAPQRREDVFRADALRGCVRVTAPHTPSPGGEYRVFYIRPAFDHGTISSTLIRNMLTSGQSPETLLPRLQTAALCPELLITLQDIFGGYATPPTASLARIAPVHTVLDKPACTGSFATIEPNLGKRKRSDTEQDVAEKTKRTKK